MIKSSVMKIAAIINPISGKGDGKKVAAILESELKGHDLSIEYTKRAGHARELAQQAAARGAGVVVAVGGDGTVNEVAGGLIHSAAALCIVPRGSGNGLAYHLGIPHRAIDAIKLIDKGKQAVIDTGTFNGKPFFCTAGVGYDAQVAADYACAGKRGLATYAQKAIEDWFGYECQDYHIVADGLDFNCKALLVTCANANQWGNNFHIAPKASVTDGFLDITIVSPISVLQALPMPVQLMGFSLDKNSHVHTYKASKILIERTGEFPAHYDGEAVPNAPARIEIACNPSSLKVVLPD